MIKLVKRCPLIGTLNEMEKDSQPNCWILIETTRLVHVCRWICLRWFPFFIFAGIPMTSTQLISSRWVKLFSISTISSSAHNFYWILTNSNAPHARCFNNSMLHSVSIENGNGVWVVCKITLKCLNLWYNIRSCQSTNENARAHARLHTRNAWPVVSLGLVYVMERRGAQERGLLRVLYLCIEIKWLGCMWCVCVAGRVAVTVENRNSWSSSNITTFFVVCFSSVVVAEFGALLPHPLRACVRAYCVNVFVCVCAQSISHL